MPNDVRGRPPVVLVHGALNDHTVWERQAAALAGAGYRVLAPDLPGHGAAPDAPLASVEAMADWLLATMRAAGIERALLAGHSLGSLVVLEAAHRHPACAAGLALLGTAAPMRVSAALLAGARDDEAAAIEMVATWSHASARENPTIIDAARALMRRLAAANPQHLLHTDLAACDAYANGVAAAASLACPVTVVIGDQDKMTPARASAALSAALAHGAVLSVGAGHAMMAEAPQAVNDALLGLAATLPA